MHIVNQKGKKRQLIWNKFTWIACIEFTTALKGIVIAQLSGSFHCLVLGIRSQMHIFSNDSQQSMTVQQPIKCVNGVKEKGPGFGLG